MYILRNYILNLNPQLNKIVNEDIYIKSGIVYINYNNIDYKYENECYFIKVDNNWINLQGGVPNYYVEENIDENLFIKLED